MVGSRTAGDYTLVVSAFEPRHTGKFALRAECSDRFDLKPILQEGAGMFSKLVRGEWHVIPSLRLCIAGNADGQTGRTGPRAAAPARAHMPQTLCTSCKSRRPRS